MWLYWWFWRPIDLFALLRLGDATLFLNNALTLPLHICLLGCILGFMDTQMTGTSATFRIYRL
jgi:hypothetical protein